MRIRALTLLLLLLLIARSADAQSHSKVAVIHSQPATARVRDVVSRLLGEIRAAGFEPVIIQGDSALDPRELVERPTSGAFATIAIVASDGHIDVWVGDHVTDKTSVRRIDSIGKDARTIAIRAVELVRASLLETSTQPDKTVAADVSRWIHDALSRQPQPVETRGRTKRVRPAPPAPPSRRTSMGLSPGLLLDSSGVGPTLAPMLSVSHDVGVAALFARYSVTGSVFAPTIREQGASVPVPQLLLMAELGRAFRDRSGLVPLLSVSVGLHHLRLGRIPVNETHFAFATGGSVGLAYRLGDRLSALLDGHLLVVAPAPLRGFNPAGRVGLGIVGAL